MKITINNAQIDLSEEQKQDLLKQLNATTKVKIRPCDEERYYRIVDYKYIMDQSYNSGYDIDSWNFGNGFLTREEAEKELAKRLAIQRVKDYIKLNGMEFEPDWEDYDSKNYALYYNACGRCISWVFYSSSKHYSPIGYLKSEEDCNKLIEDNREDLLLIYK